MKFSHPSHASRVALALSASLLLAATAAQGQTTFSFYFNNGTGGTRTSALHQWTTSVGTSGTLVSTIGVSPFPGSGVSNGNAVAAIAGQSSFTGFCYYLPDASVPPGATPGVLMLYGNNTNTETAFQTNQDKWARVGTANLTGLTVGDITQLSVFTRPATTATVMRFAIKVDGAWYASASSFSQTDLTVFEQRVVNPNAINWISGVGVTGTSLDDDLSDNPSAPLPATGVVTNYGWYADTDAQSGANARVRIDSYQIATALGSDAYTAWAGGTFANPFPEGQRGAEVDFDNDGLRNQLEFVLGGDPTLSQAGVSPSVVSASGVDLVITFNRSDASELQPVAVKVQVSDDLANWNPADDIAIGSATNAGPIGGTGASYTVAENGSAADTIVVTIPKGAVSKKFARVVATQ